MAGPLFDRTLQASRAALSGLTRRQHVIANNIANADTPGFGASEVDFETTLSKAVKQQQPARITLARTDARHLGVQQANVSAVEPTIRQQTGRQARLDGNNVDIEGEMARLAESQITYSAVTQATNSKLAGLRTAVSDGRK